MLLEWKRIYACKLQHRVLMHLLLPAGASLNSLPAGMVAAALACLLPGGNFVEIGKRDIWSAARVAQGSQAVHHLFLLLWRPEFAP